MEATPGAQPHIINLNQSQPAFMGNTCRALTNTHHNPLTQPQLVYLNLGNKGLLGLKWNSLTS